jgi:hypothetical protein
VYTEEGRANGDVVKCAGGGQADGGHFLIIHIARQQIDRRVLAAREFHGYGQAVGHDMQMVVSTQCLCEVARGGSSIDQNAISVRYKLRGQLGYGFFLTYVFPFSLRVADAFIAGPSFGDHIVTRNCAAPCSLD